MDGWVKLYRKIIEWEWFKTPNMVHLFLYLLCKANHSEGKWQGEMIKKGQLITSRKTIRKETGISEQSIRTCINKLKSTNEITIKSTNKYSIITINNYESYQNINESTNQQSNQPTNQQLTSKQPQTRRIKKDIYKWRDETLSSDKDVDKLFKDFLSMRESIKINNSKLSVTRLKNRLKLLTKDKHEAIEIIDNSIINQWKGFFPLKK